MTQLHEPHVGTEHQLAAHSTTSPKVKSACMLEAGITADKDLAADRAQACGVQQATVHAVINNGKDASTISPPRSPPSEKQQKVTMAACIHLNANHQLAAENA